MMKIVRFKIKKLIIDNITMLSFSRRSIVEDFLNNTRSFHIIAVSVIQSLLLQTQQFLLVGHILPRNH